MTTSISSACAKAGRTRNRNSFFILVSLSVGTGSTQAVAQMGGADPHAFARGGERAETGGDVERVGRLARDIGVEQLAGGGVAEFGGVGDRAEEGAVAPCRLQTAIHHQ